MHYGEFMIGWTTLRRQWRFLLTYAVAMWLSVHLTRFDGGVAFLWGATAILIATLLRTSRANWGVPLLACGVIGAVITAVWGLGPVLALPFGALNLLEAALAAWLMRRWTRHGEALESLSWLLRFVAAAGIIAPFVAGLVASSLLAATGRDFTDTMLRFFTGHALGNLTFTPIALLLIGRRARKETLVALRRQARTATVVLPITLAVSLAVFLQNNLPLLFLPISAVITASFRLGRFGAAGAICIVALTGGLLTALGHGPITLVDAEIGARMLFFQFYLAVTVLTVLPVTAELHTRQHILRRIRISEARFRMIAQHSADILMHLTVDGRIRYVSPAMKRIAGHNPDALVGRHRAELIAPEHRELVRLEHRLTLAAGGATRTYQYRALMVDGSARWFATHACAVYDEDGQPDGVIAVIRDMSAQKAREDSLQLDAWTDPLTGLPNRRALEARLARLNRLAIDGEPRASLALLDIDHFKRINDTHGHDVGDAVLKKFAVIARGMLREHDFIARIGGEEFVVVLPHTRPEAALAMCDRLRAQVGSGPVIVGKQALSVTLSGGVAVFGPDGLEVALKAADIALYDAKNGGRNQLRLAA